MNHCKVPVFFAYLSIAYIASSVYYMIMTRKLGTPFNDSLTKEQREIKEKASRERKAIFCNGIMLSVILIVVIQPFSSCN